MSRNFLFILWINITIEAKNKDFTQFDKDMLMLASLEISPRSFNKDFERN